MVVSEPNCKCPKRVFEIFTLWVIFTYFKKFDFLKVFYLMLSMRRHFITACSKCVGILLPHAEHA
jgi:hypothetical protein